MDADPVVSSAQSPSKVSEKEDISGPANPKPSDKVNAGEEDPKVSEKEDISSSANPKPSDKVKAGEEDPKRIVNDETPKPSASTEAPSEKVKVQLPVISTASEPSTVTAYAVPCPPNASPCESVPSVFSPSGLSTWAKNFKFPQQDSKAINSGMLAFARFTSELGLHLPTKGLDKASDSKSPSTQVGDALESLTKAVVDSSRSAVKAVQVKARHMVSQNKRRYQEGEFDLDMTYITENIIAMGFPAGDLSSGLFGFFEGLYRNHMEEVIKFFETHHKGKYKVYNLCSERLYDASRFEGKVASFPFDDHNCPPIQLIPSFCQSAYSYLKEDIQNVVVVHCKAGMARTGLMICCLLLFLKFFPTAVEAIDYYNQKRCIDGKALVLPSQIRYVKYYERIQNFFKGEVPPGRRCMLRGFRLINCPYWIRPSITISNHSGVLFSTRKHPKTKDLSPEDFWIKAPKKGVVVFALPGEPGLTELVGDFKIHFHNSDGDFYCWLNTTMAENRTMLSGGDLDGFDKRKMPAPGFHVEIVMIDSEGTLPAKPKSDSSPGKAPPPQSSSQCTADSTNTKPSSNKDDDVFSDIEDEPENLKPREAHGLAASEKAAGNEAPRSDDLVKRSDQSSSSRVEIPVVDSAGASDIKAIAADASVFSFGDDEDFESD